jgi:beta-galactosidase/beta-glucuronidase
MLQLKNKILLLLFLMASSGLILAQKTEIQYLSGTGSDQTVNWRFLCTAGMNSGKWTTIPVPSNWELQGFGTYNYGHAKDSVRGMEQGLYMYNFTVPLSMKGQQVNIVFEGSMTDTEVKINGKLAGAIHQGAFYRFKYDISKLLNYGKVNLLEVKVSKHSANTSVNKAERYADYWIFGGIFRPVYLEAKPVQNIERVAIDANADGSFAADVFLKNLSTADQVSAQVTDLKGNPVGAAFSVPLTKGQKEIRLSSVISGIKTWHPEYPEKWPK